MTSKALLRLAALSALVSVVGISGAAERSLEAGSKAAVGRISLNQSSIALDAGEPSYVHYSARDLAAYLKEITGTEVPIRTSPDDTATSLIIVGKKMAQQVMADVLNGKELGEEGYLIRSIVTSGKVRLLVTGTNPQGTKFGVAALMKMIQAGGRSAYVKGPVDMTSRPRFAVRGMHLNGWPINYPYSFRAWKEEDWKRYIDILSYQGVNLFFIWPFLEIMPVPLSAEDKAHLEEVRRVVDYAQKQRGMQIWIMHSVTRVAQSNLAMPDPRSRYYWVWNQIDMNPGDPRQLDAILRSREALYKIVNNADGYAMIDSDPGGWPYSPLSDLMKVFKGMRGHLDRYSLHGSRAKLVNWMHFGWGVERYMETSKKQEFISETIRTMQKQVAEPWWLIAGYREYLPTCKKEGVLGKTIFLPYGAVEGEPSYPATNVPLDRVRKALDSVADFPELKGLMGNNQTPLLQFPLTYYFLASAWNFEHQNRNDRDVLLELCGHLYPERKDVIAEAYLALNETDPHKIDAIRGQIENLIKHGKLGRPGLIGRKLFPDSLQVARDLVSQLKVRAARQTMCRALTLAADKNDSARVIESYLDAVLTWTDQNGWHMMVDVVGWRRGYIVSDQEFVNAMSNLKRALGGASPGFGDARIASFFDPIAINLLRKYGPGAVLRGCIEPMKAAIKEAP